MLNSSMCIQINGGGVKAGYMVLLYCRLRPVPTSAMSGSIKLLQPNEHMGTVCCYAACAVKRCIPCFAMDGINVLQLNSLTCTRLGESRCGAATGQLLMWGAFSGLLRLVVVAVQCQSGGCNVCSSQQFGPAITITCRGYTFRKRTSCLDN